MEIEHTVGKGEIARYEEFLLFPHCFQKTSTAHTGLFGRGLNGYAKSQNQNSII